ncbi:MAG: S1C family serine protease [Phycisphaerae bacterium]
MRHVPHFARTAASAGLLLLAPWCRPAEAAPNVAPNTVRRALDSAAAAVVKLHGGRLAREHGYGTGFLISADGDIVTAASLLLSGRSLRAVLSDGRAFPARLVRSDDYRKIALLKIDGQNLPHLDLTKTDQLAVGDTVIALGNWYKVAEDDEPVSVSRGILSLRTHLHARRLTQPFPYRGPVLVCDAITSNPGAAGGPLLDIDGNCVGMIGHAVEAVDTNTRVNYALPSEEIIAFLGGARAPRAATRPAADRSQAARPYVGIRISKLGFHHVAAYVERVRPGSPAARAGIRPDDLIVAIDGRRIGDARGFREAIQAMTPGQVVTFIIKRGGSVLSIDVTIGETP